MRLSKTPVNPPFARWHRAAGYFAEYAKAVAGQREATRQRSLEQYFKVNSDAGNAMGRLQGLRQQLVAH
jgi:hypothetical protein